MKSLLALSLTFSLMLSLVAGCAKSESVDYSKIGIKIAQTIDTSVNQEFTLSRSFDLNSGYMWREKYDEKMLELLESSIDTEKHEDGTIVLLQVFRFKALKKGKTYLVLAYSRLGLEGEMVARQDIIEVNIN
jgi:predicted secreted protein